jgi:acetyltransferase-like isoleucine patch superfamily enzyme
MGEEYRSVRLPRVIRALTALPPSRRRQWVALNRARLITATLYAARLRRLGKRTIIQKPLFWTPEFIEIGDDVLIWPGCRIEGITEHDLKVFAPRIVIGNGASFQQNCHITCAGDLQIGGGTVVLYGALITDIDHAYEALNVSISRQPLIVRATRIGRNCFIGAGARIQAGTILGDHCIVGTNAVVRGTFPDHCVIAGVPARIVKRFDAASGAWRKVNSEGKFL